MAALTAALAGATIVSGAAGLYSAYQQADATKRKSEFDAKQLQLNSEIADMQAGDAVDRGNKAASQYQGKINQTVGSQRAALAAQGIDVNSGSAMDIQDNTRAIGEQDVLTIKNNAWREAWGYKMEALNSKGSSIMTQVAGENNYRNTLLTGGLQALGSGIKGAAMIGGK